MGATPNVSGKRSYSPRAKRLIWTWARLLVDPAATARASSTATERPFSFARYQAVAAPTAPAPTITTSARLGREEGESAIGRVRRGRGREREGGG